MQKIQFLHSATALFAMLTITACGKSEQTAMVTLVTGLESASRPINLMEKITSLKLFTGGQCSQTQLYAGFGPHQDGGPPQLATFPVSLTTPLANGSAQIESSYQNGVAGWLAASSLKTITLPAPVGVSLDFGILGALNVSSTASADGTCPLTVPGSTGPNETYSLIGHSVATISGATVVPVKLWVNSASPSSTQRRTRRRIRSHSSISPSKADTTASEHGCSQDGVQANSGRSTGRAEP